MKRLRRHEVFMVLLIVAVGALISLANPAFLSAGNLLTLLKSNTVVALFAIGFLLVLITGGIDVSFAAVAVFAMYVTVKLAGANGDWPPLALFAASAGIGALLGALNGLLVTWLKVSSLIVTLGTLSLYKGFLLFFVGTDTVRQVPAGMSDFARASYLKFTTANGGAVGVHVSIFLVAAVALAVWLLLRFTTFGRKAYALGGDREAARRAGFSVARIELTIYVLAGALAGIAGMASGAMIRLANPFSIVGIELDVIAAVVIGGASIFGGRGTVLGALLGVLLIALIKNCLVLLGIPAEWQKVVVGLLILTAIALPAAQRGLRRLQPRSAGT